MGEQEDSFIAGFFVGGIIFANMFNGFTEIIKLLQQNMDNQNEILFRMGDKTVIENGMTKTVRQDIESNLLEM